MSKYFVKNTRSNQYLKRNDGDNKHHRVLWTFSKEEATFNPTWAEADNFMCHLPHTSWHLPHIVIVDENDETITKEVAKARGNYSPQRA